MSVAVLLGFESLHGVRLLSSEAFQPVGDWFNAQDDFFGSRRHAGWAWLPNQAREWSVPYRTCFWTFTLRRRQTRLL